MTSSVFFNNLIAISNESLVMSRCFFMDDGLVLGDIIVFNNLFF